MGEKARVQNAEEGQTEHLEEIWATRIVEELTRERQDKDKPLFELRDKMILGRLDLRHRIVNVALEIQNCTFQDEVDLRYCEFKQTVNFSGCRFRKDFLSGDATESKTIYRKDLICNGAIFEETVGFNGPRFENSAFFNQARFLNEEQQVDFAWAVVEVSLECQDAVFRGSTSFYSLKCDGSGFFERTKFEGEDGPDFSSASFEKNLECNDAVFKGSASFNSLKCGDTGFFERTKFEGEDGPNFDYASFEGDLRCSNAMFKGFASFYALKCGFEGIFNDSEFESQETTDFTFARIGSSLKFFGTAFAGPVDLTAAHVTRYLDLTGADFRQEVTLYNASIGIIELGGSYPFADGRFVDLRGCAFERFQSGEKDVAIRFARHQDPEQFSRDPYQHLEKYYEAIGDEAEAKRIHYLGRRDRRENAKDKDGRTKWPWPTRWGDWWLKYLTGYGVRTWLLLLWIGFFLIAGTAVFWSEGALKARQPPASQASGGTSTPPTRPSEEHKLFNRAAYSLDLFLPVVNLRFDERWEPEGLIRGIYALFHSLIGWLLIPLLVASLAGIVRR